MIVWKLDELMRLRGVKGRELARRMNIGENYLSRVRHEVPDRLSLTLLDALCRELGCGIGDLLEYKAPGRARKAASSPPRVDGSAAATPAVTPPPAPVAAPASLAAPAAAASGDDTGLAAESGSAFIEDVLAPLFAELGPAAGIVEQAMADTPAEVAAPEAAPAEVPAAGSAVLRTSALQARLERLKRQRKQP